MSAFFKTAALQRGKHGFYSSSFFAFSSGSYRAFDNIAACAGTKCYDSRQSVFVMKIATATFNDGNHEWMKRFASAIETKSGGRIKAELYPASQLGSVPRQIEGTQLGSIQMCLHPPEFFVGVDQRFELLSAAGLFESEQHAIRAITDPEFAKAFLALGASKGLIGAGLILGAPQGFAMRVLPHARGP